MPNAPRADNPHRSVRVEDELWQAAKEAADVEDTTRGDVMREALRALVARHAPAGRWPTGLAARLRH